MEIKVDICRVHTTKRWGRESMAPYILILSTRRRSPVIFTLQLLRHSEKTPVRDLYHIAWDGGWASEPVWAFWRGEKNRASAGN
jgi:hypothetical protein